MPTNTMADTRPTDLATARVTRDMARAMATPAMATQARSQWRLAIGHTIRVALVITSAMPIMFGGRDIGHGGTVAGFGFTVTTC